MLETVSFRCFVPLFNLESDQFQFTGTFEDTKYTIDLLRISEGCRELEDFAPPNLCEAIDAHIFKDSIFYVRGRKQVSVLKIETTQPISKDLEVSTNSWELLDIEEAIVTAINLTSTLGLNNKVSYTIRLSPTIIGNTAFEPNDGFSWSKPKSTPQPFNYAGKQSSRIEKTEETEELFNYLLKFKRNDLSKSQRIFKLAYTYFRTSFTLSHIEHSYLMLMIVFEALFKEKEIQGAKKAAKLLKEIVYGDHERSVKKEVQQSFIKEPNGFIDLRNQISHGEIVEYQTIKPIYPQLFEIIKESLKKILILIGQQEISDDYFKSINAIAYRKDDANI